jgi:cell division initiation protein
MKISPIDIRQHTFEKGFRGYNIDEVNAFLNSLSQEWERVLNEQKMLKMQLEIAEKELNKLKDVEMTLFRTLKTAEESSLQITDKANKAAEKYLEESKQKSDEHLNEAKRKAAMLIQDAESQARYIKESMSEGLKNQERDFKAIEKYRDNLIVQLRSLANTTNETVDRFEAKFSKESLLTQIDDLRNQLDAAPVVPTQEVALADEEIQDELIVGEEEPEVTDQPLSSEEAEVYATEDEPTPVGEAAPAEPETEEEPATVEVENTTEVTEAAAEEEASDAAAEAMEAAMRLRRSAEEAASQLQKKADELPKGTSFFDQIG